ncbi:hypothetical protein CsSME_00046828 [Camellia sinensis var. sinensis]
MRLYGPNPLTLQALRGFNIELLLDVPNPDLPALGSDPSAASKWVQNNVGNYISRVSSFGTSLLETKWIPTETTLLSLLNLSSPP